MQAVCFPDDVSVTLIAATSQSVRFARFSFPRKTVRKGMYGISAAYVYDMYLLQVGFHLVAAVGRLVQN